jgi:hypothetical protein
MGNIITSSREMLGLSVASLGKKKEEKSEKRIVIPHKYMIRGKGLYSFVRRM